MLLKTGKFALGCALVVLLPFVNSIERGHVVLVESSAPANELLTNDYVIDQTFGVISIDQGFEVIRGDVALGSTLRVTKSAEPEYKLAVDKQTDRQVIATREIQVSYVLGSLTEEQIEQVSAEYGFEATRNFAHLGVFFGKVKSFENVPNTLQLLRADTRFIAADLQVIQHLYTTR